MKRINRPDHARFLTFSTYRCERVFGDDLARRVFRDALVRGVERHGVMVYAWVLMPDHAHLLIRAGGNGDPTAFLRGLKSGVSRSVVRGLREDDPGMLDRLEDPSGRVRVWQRGGGYDRNVVDGAEFDEKVRSIHHNPVKAGLVVRAEDWVWGSARWWAGIREVGDVACVSRRV